ncbi:septal ring lytic transglycosylase RlpA family protein [Stutzerimonas azotifigens]|uniref:septal ring lytic transglycosylase RlpA family protein n=1 Tax=Stutzerimonas azotifigens TaxID=291995 RepID=UPI0003FAF437|nr:septal ring lytic transglycosylase RlpA family protein [Stutzerimonas azotifigens]
MRLSLRSPLIALLAAVLLASCAEVPTPRPGADREPAPAPRERHFSQEGKASFYARMHHGERTANGERHDQNALVAAHRSLPFGTQVRVTNLDNGRQVTVRINDRGPYQTGRIIDLSRAAARKLGMLDDGVVRVRIEADL